MAENTQLNTSTVPIPTTFGGSGVTSATAYGTLLGGTTTTAAMQVTAPSISGWVLRSRGAGITPEFQPPDAILVGSASATSVASIDFTDLAVEYFAYKFVINYMVPATDGVILLIRLSTDNGSTFISTAGAYAYHTSIYAAALTDWSSTSATSMQPALNTGNASSIGGVYGEITLINPAYNTIYTNYVGTIINRNSSSVTENCIVAGTRNNAEANNAIRFAFNSGNIADAMIRVYGLKAH